MPAWVSMSSFYHNGIMSNSAGMTHHLLPPALPMISHHHDHAKILLQTADGRTIMRASAEIDAPFSVASLALALIFAERAAIRRRNRCFLFGRIAGAGSRSVTSDIRMSDVQARLHRAF